MSYMHINNLYREQTILMFKEVYAMEKVHGSSANVAFKAPDQLNFFAGGTSHVSFLALFDRSALLAMFQAMGLDKITVYGEAYGGKMQGMRETYGPELRFIAFEVLVGNVWLSVPDAEQVATGLGFEFVPYERITTDLTELDRVRDMPSEVARRRGCGDNKTREGVVLRPLREMTTSNGDRVLAKHKQDAFSERATPQKIVNPAKLKVLEEANEIAQEWVTEMRLQHVLGKIQATEIRHVPLVISAMKEDIFREAEGEIVESKEAEAAIGKRTALLYKQHLNQKIRPLEHASE